MRALAAALLALSLGCAAPPAPSAADAPAASPVAISWEQALALIRSGEVRSVAQTHALEVALVTADGARYTAREPGIDAVLHAVRELAPNAGGIAIATE
ncbi:MAG TPA: hypothetical protein VII78_05695 [Myxococcota bacterium]|jgi:hypothetical protein